MLIFFPPISIDKFFNVTNKLHNELQEWREDRVLHPEKSHDVGKRMKYNQQKFLNILSSTEIDFMFNAKVTEPTPQELINLHPHETSFYKHSSRSSVSSPTSRRSKRTSRKKISDCFEVGRRVKSFIKPSDESDGKAYVSSFLLLFLLLFLYTIYVAVLVLIFFSLVCLLSAVCRYSVA